MLALHHAIESMDLATAKNLLEQGADVNAGDPDFGGATALHLSVDIECEDACRRFDHGNSDASPIATLTKLLLDYGADPTVEDFSGKTPRDWAVGRDHLEALIHIDARR